MAKKRSKPEVLKVVLLGDSTVGKTCLLFRQVYNTFPQDYIPTVFENWVELTDIGGTVYNLGIPEITRHGYDEAGYVIVMTKCDLYQHRRKKQMYERVQSDHPRMLRSLLSEQLSLPSDLFRFLLKYAEYTREEMDYDERVESELIHQEEIERWLRTELKFGVWKTSESAPFIRTSAVSGDHLSDGALYEAVEQSFLRSKRSTFAQSGRGCQLL